MIFGALAAIGAGLHVAAYYLEHQTTAGRDGNRAEHGDPGVDLRRRAVRDLRGVHAAPRSRSTSRCSRGTTGVIVLSVVLAALGAGVATCLLVLMLAPVVTVVGYETVGHRHVAEALARMEPRTELRS